VATGGSTDAHGGGSQRSPLGRFSSFAAVGFAGFIIDATILSTLVHLGHWHHYGARALSFATAVTVTWYLNRRWVFSRTSNLRREYGAYFGVQTLGAAINLGTYALMIAAIPPLARYPVLPLAAGAVLALLFNYSAAGRWVFTPSTSRVAK
jgi:putative flippase GtrA